MSSFQTRLCTQLLAEYFGGIVSKIGYSLIVLGPSTLSLVASHSKESINNCRKSLATLIQHQLVTFVKHERGFIVYSIVPDRILLTLRYPKYIYVAKFLYGAIGEQIIEKIIKEGMLTVNDVVKKVTPDLDGALDETPSESIPKLVYDTFVRLVGAKFIARCCVYSEANKLPDWYPKPVDDLDEKDLLEVPPLKICSEGGEPQAKRRRKEESNQTEDVIYWMVNVEPFHIALRDMMIVEGLRSHYGDDNASQLVRAILRCGASDSNVWMKETLMVAKTEIINYCSREGLVLSSEDIDTYLLFLVDDGNDFVVMSEERAGISRYQVNTFKIMDKLVKSCVTSAAIDRFGPRSGRIFNLLLTRKLLQQKQIEELAMVDPKDAKECTYSLFKNRFIKIMQFPTQSDYTPSKTCFLFSTDIEDVCRSMMERCYQAIFNCIVRRNHENRIHKSLIDRKVFIDAVVTNLRLQSGQQPDIEQQIEELNQSFSSHDRDLLEKLKKLSFTLEMSELKIDETLFLMQSWIAMNLAQ